ncbi:hypothetical protein MBM_07269 [Drepanopeziza brunnea f. sp. 'multigermtubi' MB_m1]|uniref:Uncharacterized protein n=1 Tax=Marssonina brunnea f. sp. multigermtubi (strain MB_m1) TaxID=1072389 RepID=K1X115_MARBU|nr:uncharacterized protein MBM_07269 [Drepanopeziza brunnea f. sp. 'multigermtubi' MB_m1]EKD14548.1 hypothetical protein MBM_07269 [Drepanopeziza brunnea f. sp. 'multigermtubi' MB_m1]
MDLFRMASLNRKSVREKCQIPSSTFASNDAAVSTPSILFWRIPSTGVRIQRRQRISIRSSLRGFAAYSKKSSASPEHPVSMLLLSLIHIWGGQDIPTLMLHRVAQPQKRWNIQGEIEEAALDQETVSHFSRVSVDANGSGLKVSFARGPVTARRQSVSHRVSQTLRRLHLRVIQHVTEFVVDLVERRLLSSQQQLDFADVLLESSKLADASSKGHDWRFKAVDIAEKILASHPNHILHISAIIRRKALSRLITGKIYHEPVLSGIPLTAQSNALLWDLRLSKAQDYVEDDDFTGAQQEISHFVSFGPSQASTLENLFPPGAELHDSLIYLLVGVNCELRNPTEALRLAEAPARHPKTQSRRMNVLLAEAHLHVGMEACRLSNSRPSPTSLTEARLLCEKDRARPAGAERGISPSHSPRKRPGRPGRKSSTPPGRIRPGADLHARNHFLQRRRSREPGTREVDPCSRGCGSLRLEEAGLHGRDLPLLDCCSRDALWPTGRITTASANCSYAPGSIGLSKLDCWLGSFVVRFYRRSDSRAWWLQDSDDAGYNTRRRDWWRYLKIRGLLSVDICPSEIRGAKDHMALGDYHCNIAQSNQRPLSCNIPTRLSRH